MKAKLIRLEGTIEAEGTPEELARLFRATAAPTLLPLAPFISSFTISPPPGCVHEYPEPWISVSPPSCKKCGHVAWLEPSFTVAGYATTSGHFPNGTISVEG